MDKDKNFECLWFEGKVNTSSTSENKEKAHDGYVCIYKCRKNLLHSAYKHACTSHERSISHIKEIVEIIYYEIKEICSTDQDMHNYIDSYHKESERHTAYP